ncbi:unnamed protein product [Rhizoctonia solani]|uniref:Uncharacterized protein n=1 Tax=Rhizoctonia solani TaxID=456999 RepID=A0A8H3DZH4_9AGAM|nr:unnamed protein product [Rhizoctonia solani]
MPDGTGIIYYNFQSQIIVQNINTGNKELRSLQRDTSRAWLDEFSLDCTRIANATINDHTLYIYDTLTGQRILRLPNLHTSYVRSMKFSPDGTQMVSGSEDETIRVTDIQTIPAYLPSTSPEDFGEWSVREDGWAVNELCKLLVWVPPDLRASLMHPRTKLLISRRGYLRLNFESVCIGESWANCYRGV